MLLIINLLFCSKGGGDMQKQNIFIGASSYGKNSLFLLMS